MDTKQFPVSPPYTLRVSHYQKYLALFGLFLLWGVDVIIFMSSNASKTQGVILVTIFAAFYSIYLPYLATRLIVVDDDCIKYKTIFSTEVEIAYTSIKQVKIRQIALYSATYIELELSDASHLVQQKKNSVFLNMNFIPKKEWGKLVLIIATKNPSVALDYRSSLMVDGKFY